MNNDQSAPQVEISKLLWLDDEFICDQALCDVLGDRYLCGSNVLFARMRQLFFSNGFRYSSDATRMWRDYGSMPLLMLQEILDSGVVPFKDNAATLRRISEKNPSLVLPTNHLLSLLGRNYLLHESAHCISYRILSHHFGFSGDFQSQKQLYVFLCIFCEAYANLMERFSAALADSDPHRFFFTINSFVECRTDMTSLLKDSIRIFGLDKTFVVGMLTLYYLNTHGDNPSEKVAETIMDIAFPDLTLPDVGQSFLKVLISQGFGLHQKFRTETTPLFFRYMTCENELELLYQQPFDRNSLREWGLMGGVSDLCRATCTDLTLNATSTSTRQDSNVISQA